MVIKANSLNNAATKYLAHCQIIITFLIGIYNLKAVAIFTNSVKKCMDIENVGSVQNSGVQPGDRLPFF